MASSKIKNINIKIGADTRGLDAALKGIENKSKSAKNELSAINGTLQKAPESLTVWKQKQELLTKAIENSREKVKLLEDAQEQVAKQLASGKISDEQYRAFQRELEKARAEVSRFDEQLYDTNKKIEKLGEKAKDSGKGLKNSLEDAQDELKKVDKSIKKAPDSLVLWKQKQELLTKSIEESRKKVKSLENQQEEMKKKLQNGEIDEGAYRAFQRELEEARGEAKDLENQLGDTNKKIYDFENGTENGRKGIADFGDSMEDAGKDADELSDSVEESGKSSEKASDGYTVFKDVLGNLVTQGINLAIEKVKAFTTEIIETGKAFEASMSNVGAISGATGDELEKLSEKAKQMGATTKYTASQSADAFGYMALAGWETEDMLAGIDGVLSLAAASNMDLAKASDIVTDYLTAFGLTAQDSSKFVDQMSYAMSKSNTTTELLGEAYKNCAATAASMGYSVEETTAVLMTMANAGVKGGEAGTALNAIMTRLATDTKECATELKSYGVNVYDTQGNMQSLSSILQGVSGVWTTLTDQQQSNLAKIIAGTNHYSALQTIMNGLSDSAKESGMSFTDYASALEECDGTARKMADTMIDNLAGDMTILDSSIDGVKIALADKLNPIIRDLVQYITEKMPEIQEKAEEIFDSGVDIFEWCKSNIPILLSSVKNFFGVIFKIFPDFTKHLDIIIPLVTSFATGLLTWNSAKNVTTFISNMIPVVKSLNTVLAANPAVAVATAVVALGTAISAFCIQAQTKLSETEKIAERVDKKYKEEHENIQKIREDMQKLQESFYDSADAIDHEFDRTEKLRKKLNELVEANGTVLEKNQKRVDYILGELNQALGTEYTMTGNQIKNYQNLRDEIDKTIAKKKAEAMINAYLASSSEMAKAQAEDYKEYITASQQADEASDERKKAEKRFDELTKDIGYSYIDILKLDAGDRRIQGITDEQYQAAVALDEAIEKQMDAQSRKAETKSAWLNSSEWNSRLEEAEILLTEEEYGKIPETLYGERKKSFDAENATEDEMKKEFQEQHKKLEYDINLKLDASSQSDINELIGQANLVIDYGKKGGISEYRVADNTQRELIHGINNRNLSLADYANANKDSGIDITMFYGDDFDSVIANQAKYGHDILDSLEWTAKSETAKISQEYWGVFADYIQKRLDEGFNVEKLIDNGAKAGIDWGEAFNGNYMDIIQKQINNGFDPTKLIESWAEVDEKAAEDFKKNSVDVIQKMLDKGFDPTNLMQWFLNNGVDGTKLFTDEMKKEFEKADFSGIKMEGLFKQFEELFKEEAEKGADIYKEHFISYVNGYINQNLYKQKVDSGKMKPNSKWDADLYSGKVNYDLNESLNIRDSLKAAKFATGGYISAGNSGIIAEAGPELIEVMNGGVRITPMREKARNTEVSDNTAGQKIFYNTYNLNNPRISNDMDVRQIAQKLAIEQRRIERGRGIF